MTDDAEPANPVRTWAAYALVAGAALCALAVHRHGEREALRSGGTPVAEGPPQLAFVPLIIESGPPRHELPVPPAPAPSSSAPLVPADLEQLAVATFSDARPALLACLREERARRPGAAGKLPVTVRVDPNGLVAEVHLGASPLRGEAFDECVQLSVAELVFPGELARRDLSLTYDLQ